MGGLCGVALTLLVVLILWQQAQSKAAKVAPTKRASPCKLATPAERKRAIETARKEGMTPIDALLSPDGRHMAVRSLPLSMATQGENPLGYISVCAQAANGHFEDCVRHPVTRALGKMLQPSGDEDDNYRSFFIAAGNKIKQLVSGKELKERQPAASLCYGDLDRDGRLEFGYHVHRDDAVSADSDETRQRRFWGAWFVTAPAQGSRGADIPTVPVAKICNWRGQCLHSGGSGSKQHPFYEIMSAIPAAYPTRLRSTLERWRIHQRKQKDRTVVKSIQVDLKHLFRRSTAVDDEPVRLVRPVKAEYQGRCLAVVKHFDTKILVEVPGSCKALASAVDRTVSAAEKDGGAPIKPPDAGLVDEDDPHAEPPPVRFSILNNAVMWYGWISSDASRHASMMLVRDNKLVFLEAPNVTGVLDLEQKSLTRHRHPSPVSRLLVENGVVVACSRPEGEDIDGPFSAHQLEAFVGPIQWTCRAANGGQAGAPDLYQPMKLWHNRLGNLSLDDGWLEWNDSSKVPQANGEFMAFSGGFLKFRPIEGGPAEPPARVVQHPKHLLSAVLGDGRVVDLNTACNTLYDCLGGSVALTMQFEQSEEHFKLTAHGWIGSPLYRGLIHVSISKVLKRDETAAPDRRDDDAGGQDDGGLLDGLLSLVPGVTLAINEPKDKEKHAAGWFPVHSFPDNRFLFVNGRTTLTVEALELKKTVNLSSDRVKQLFTNVEAVLKSDGPACKDKKGHKLQQLVSLVSALGVEVSLDENCLPRKLAGPRACAEVLVSDDLEPRIRTIPPVRCGPCEEECPGGRALRKPAIFHRTRRAREGELVGPCDYTSECRPLGERFICLDGGCEYVCGG